MSFVIGQHTTIAYGGSGSWFYIEKVDNTLIKEANFGK